MEQTLTIDLAFKTIKQIDERIRELVNKIEIDSSYRTTEENREVDRPEFDAAKLFGEIFALQEKQLVLKNAINKFNNSHVVCDTLTIDQALVQMSMYNNMKMLLERLRLVKDKRRMPISSSGVVEYTYRNFDMDYIEDTYKKICNNIIVIQTSINQANVTQTITVDI